MIMAYQEGDKTYKYAEQPCQIQFPEKNTAGSPQTITFPKISDFKAGTVSEIPLQATSDSGLPVSYYRPQRPGGGAGRQTGPDADPAEVGLSREAHGGRLPVGPPDRAPGAVRRARRADDSDPSALGRPRHWKCRANLQRRKVPAGLKTLSVPQGLSLPQDQPGSSEPGNQGQAARGSGRTCAEAWRVICPGAQRSRWAQRAAPAGRRPAGRPG